MKKLGFSITTALALCIGAAAGAQEHRLTFAHVLTEDTPNARAAVIFKEEVEKNSDGRIAVDIRPAAVLGGDVEIIEQTQMGLVHIAIPPTGNLANFNEQMYLFDLPFLVNDDEGLKRLLDGEVGSEVLATLDANNLKGMAMWGAGFRHMTNNIRPITGPDDLRGIKMRTLQAPAILATYRAYGANPTAMAYTEVYNGLQQGVVEGQENPFANIYSMKFHEVQKYLTLTAHAYHTYAAVMHKPTWDGLPEDLQQVVLDALIVGRDAAREFTAEDDARILEEIGDQIEVIELTPEGREAFIEASQPIYDEFRPKVTPELLEKAIAAANG